MRVLQVIHQYPPHSSQGSEVYCHTLARCLAKKDDVRVFHASVSRRRWRRRTERGEHEGIPTYHCLDGGEYARVSDWPNAFLQRSFAAVLNDFRPDIVHFHNYISLGDDLVSMARIRGATVVYTLHDYGLLCPNNLLLRTDGSLCGKQTSDFFQDCCPILIRTAGGRRPLLSHHGPSLARWRTFANEFRPGLSQRLLGAAVTAAERLRGEPRTTDVPRKKAFFLEHTRRIFDSAHLLVAPSEFLRGRFVACGVPEARIVHVRYGIRHFPVPPRRKGDGHVRFGYLGALHAHKGLELLLRAFSGLGDRATLHVHGSAFGSPISEAHWARLQAGRPAGIYFHGGYDNTALGDVLAGLDVVVVPSVWYENSPLTIQESFVAGVPVITADVGGMAELVRHGVDGLHFRFGEEDDLRRKMAAVIAEPGCLTRFREAIRPVPTIESQSAIVREHYASLVNAEA